MSQTTFPPVPIGLPRELNAKLLVTTPMFIGDGEQQTRSIRPPAIKGALRFWWRALNWGRQLKQAQGNEKAALAALHQAEADLFGSAAGQDKGHQARFQLRVESMENGSPVNLPNPGPNDSLGYLLGQGLYNFKTGVQRPCIPSGATFILTLKEKPGSHKPTAKQWEQLEETLWVFGLLGGLGSRARKGLGSIAIQELSGGSLQAPKSAAEYEQALKTLRDRLETPASQLPPFTAFSGLCRLDLSAQGTQPLSLLREVGQQQQLYRSWGREEKVLGRPAEQNFGDDHDNALAATRGNRPKNPPKRAVFGLPHNYFFSSTKGKVDINAPTERRASPLFIHIHQCPDGSSIAVQLLMPAQFLPKGQEKLVYKPGGQRSFEMPFTAEQVDWSVITTYMNRFGVDPLWQPHASLTQGATS